MEKKSNHLVGSIICGILTAFGIVASIISMIGGSGTVWMVSDIFNLVLAVLIGYYAFIGYKKPHGNLLKYIILLDAVNLVFGVRAIAQTEYIGIATLTAIKIGLLCYIAGRLVKAKENLILMIALTAFEVGLCIWQFATGVATVGLVAGPVIWLDICVAYFLRYKEHKEAGLTDAPKAK